MLHSEPAQEWARKEAGSGVMFTCRASSGAGKRWGVMASPTHTNTMGRMTGDLCVGVRKEHLI
jgi:hypothetical protein